MQKVLLDLTRFCTHQFIISSKNRQKVLKEQYFIDVLLEILSNISDEEEISEYLEGLKKKKNLHHRVDAMMHSNFKALGGLIKHVQY